MKFPPRLKLAHLPTPIQKLERVSAEVGKEIFIWRDDLTGFTESGNKIRKLEFLLADALEKKAARIITSGGYQSNHTRATTFACRRLGLEVSLVVREPKTGLDGHFGEGYGVATDDDLKFYIKLARQEGLLLDPSYTGKAFQGMLAEIKKDASRFGEKILFLHSGGTFGTFAHQERYARLLAELK